MAELKGRAKGDLGPAERRRVSVIVPVLNEEATVGRVVEQMRGDPLVGEVIVVDDKSVDQTARAAKEAGATVVTSTVQGKGVSMREGLLVSRGDVLVYLDGDIPVYPDGTVERMARPVLKDRCDFVKARFSRQAGRVTELVAKPLLGMLFPELSSFSQPLGGMIAGKRSFFERLTFENDYGVDIGILIDMHALGARILEVEIGQIENRMKPWQELGKMSREVSRAILCRAIAGDRPLSLDSLATDHIIRGQMELAVKDTLRGLRKMALLDLDGTLLNGRLISAASDAFGFRRELDAIARRECEPVRVAFRGEPGDILVRHRGTHAAAMGVARLLRGVTFAQVVSLADSLGLVDGAAETVAELKRRGYIVGIVTDGYDVVAHHVKTKVGADFVLAYELEFSHGTATGEVKVPSLFMRSGASYCSHELCKCNAAIAVAREYGIERENLIAVGDGENDLCMVKYAGVGVAFRSPSGILNALADRRIEGPSLKSLLDIAF